VAEIATVGLDLAKNWFQVHAADAQGRPVLRKKLARSKVLEFFANLPPCLVGMEACGGAHHWARELIKLGHEVRLMPPQYVKPYVKTNKHDAADAEAICEAVTRPSMRFVPVKTIEQQTMAQLHRIRQLLVKQRTMHVNALRGHLAELGIVRGQGRGKAGELVRLIEAAADDGIPAKVRQQLRHLVELLRDLERRLAELDRELGELAREDPVARRLATIPGVGPITATALAMTIGDVGRFRSGRHLAAYLGLVPKQHSSGGKEQLGRISKRGDTLPPQLADPLGTSGGAGGARPSGPEPGLDWPAAAAPAGQRGGGGAGEPDGADRLGLADQGGGLSATDGCQRLSGRRAPESCEGETAARWHDRSDRGRDTPNNATSLELVPSIGARLADHPSRPTAVRPTEGRIHVSSSHRACHASPRKPLQSGDRPYTAL
jgi:transposase